MNFNTEAMAVALHEHLVYREGGTPNWAALSPERKAALVSEAGRLIQRYLTRSEEYVAPWPISITVNGKDHEVCATDISYEHVVQLAEKTGTPSMSWRIRNDPENRGGILSPGGRVTLRDGLVFNVQHTGNA